MSTINKVPASAGAEWLLGGFMLFKKSPGPMAAVSVAGLFVVLMAAISALLIVAATAALPFPLAQLGLAAYLVLMLGVPCLIFAGVIWAVSEVAQGRSAQVQHLQVGLGHVRALLVTAVVPMVGVLLSSLLLLALLGAEGVQQTNDVLIKLQGMMANGAQPDPVEVEALVATLPVIKFLFWLLVTIVMAPLIVCVVMVAVPGVIFSNQGGIAALRLSIAANAKNFTALIVFCSLLTALLFAISVAVQFVGFVVQFVLGPIVAMLVTNVLLMAVLMPVLAGTAYTAWRQMLGAPEAATTTDVAAPATHFEA